MMMMMMTTTTLLPPTTEHVRKVFVCHPTTSHNLNYRLIYSCRPSRATLQAKEVSGQAAPSTHGLTHPSLSRCPRPYAPMSIEMPSTSVAHEQNVAAFRRAFHRGLSGNQQQGVGRRRDAPDPITHQRFGHLSRWKPAYHRIRPRPILETAGCSTPHDILFHIVETMGATMGGNNGEKMGTRGKRQWEQQWGKETMGRQ